MRWVRIFIGIKIGKDEVINLTFVESGQEDGQWRVNFTHPKKKGSKKTETMAIFFDNYYGRGKINYYGCAFTRSDNQQIIFVDCDWEFIFKE